ncbi:K02A2.6-like [Cordylochernes scorpioides]|uniref:K02A2.6-like n=1 Tax=Cordylochernes scorpioides TaxID=51811 RepID=A0ABY6L3X8_9ARAC|nr:K02A2.6-like [Cordylochernes scorpioides]
MVRQPYLNEQQEARARFETRELRTFGTGDLVLVKRMHETKGRHKFEPRYRGPYEVLQRAGDTVYLLKDLETGNLDEIHIDRMKAYLAPVKTYPVEDKNLQDQINDVINDEDHWVHPTYPIYSPRPVEPEEPKETAIIRSPIGIVNGVFGDNIGGLEIRRSTRCLAKVFVVQMKFLHRGKAEKVADDAPKTKAGEDAQLEMTRTLSKPTYPPQKDNDGVD